MHTHTNTQLKKRFNSLDVGKVENASIIDGVKRRKCARCLVSWVSTIRIEHDEAEKGNHNPIKSQTNIRTVSKKKTANKANDTLDRSNN